MGAYLSSPVTGKELYEGAKEGYLEYGGASMQVIPKPRAAACFAPGARGRCRLVLAAISQRASLNVHRKERHLFAEFLFDTVWTCMA